MTERAAEQRMTDSIAASGPGVPVGAATVLPAKPRRRRARLTTVIVPYLQAAPLAVILIVFLLIPIVTILIVSFWDYDFARIIPGFILTNYAEAIASPVTWKTYLNTIKYAAIVGH